MLIINEIKNGNKACLCLPSRVSIDKFGALEAISENGITLWTGFVDMANFNYKDFCDAIDGKMNLILDEVECNF